MKVWSFGVEIECFIPKHSLTALKNFTAGVLSGSDQYFTHSHLGEYKSWSIHRDGSLICSSGKNIGVELVSPVFHFKELEDGLNSIKAVMEFLRSIGGFVNRRCGFHIHIGGKYIRTATLSDLALLEREWIATGQDKLIKLLPGHRKNNRYCKQNKLDDDYCDRYRMLNTLPAWRAHSTVEFRLFQGTLDPDKARVMIDNVKQFMDSVEL
jgi:hypothetical protein